MKLAEAFANLAPEDIHAKLAGGALTVYSVARPVSADVPVDRSGVLAVFTFASPAFGPASNGLESPNFVENPVAGEDVGTPGFARAVAADGTVVADFSAGPGPREIKFQEVSCTHGAPVRITQFKFLDETSWPEKPQYYETHPRSGYPMPATR
jgi:hypothetical protein